MKNWLKTNNTHTNTAARCWEHLSRAFKIQCIQPAKIKYLADLNHSLETISKRPLHFGWMINYRRSKLILYTHIFQSLMQKLFDTTTITSTRHWPLHKMKIVSNSLHVKSRTALIFEGIIIAVRTFWLSWPFSMTTIVVTEPPTENEHSYALECL